MIRENTSVTEDISAIENKVTKIKKIVASYKACNTNLPETDTNVRLIPIYSSTQSRLLGANE